MLKLGRRVNMMVLSVLGYLCLSLLGGAVPKQSGLLYLGIDVFCRHLQQSNGQIIQQEAVVNAGNGGGWKWQTPAGRKTNVW